MWSIKIKDHLPPSIIDSMFEELHPSYYYSLAELSSLLYNESLSSIIAFSNELTSWDSELLQKVLSASSFSYCSIKAIIFPKSQGIFISFLATCTYCLGTAFPTLWLGDFFLRSPISNRYSLVRIIPMIETLAKLNKRWKTIDSVVCDRDWGRNSRGDSKRCSW